MIDKLSNGVTKCQNYMTTATTPKAKPRIEAATELESAAVWVSANVLRPWKDNPRKNERAVPKVAESIKRFGFGNPILARKENGEIIAGHTRWAAAKSLGMDRVPVRYLDLDPADAHLLALADNKLGEIAEWDDAVLGAVLAELKAQGADLDASGFSTDELDALLSEMSTTGDGTLDVVDHAAELQKKWGTELGQLWTMPSMTVRDGEHRIVCGSSLDADVVARVMAGDLADLMWTDPPYGVSYVGKTKAALTIQNDELPADGLRAFLADCFKVADSVMKPGAAWYIAHPAGPLCHQFLLAIEDVAWKFRQGLVWVKDSMVLGRSDYHYKHEPIMFGYKAGEGRRGRGGDGWYGDNSEVSVFEVDRPKVSDFHPTMKPVELVSRMVRNSCPPKGIVYEPFSGSGTTMLAAESSSRLSRACELDPKYVAVALERMNEIGCEPKLSNGKLRAA